jgi:CHASE2 domain-containing sensor protein
MAIKKIKFKVLRLLFYYLAIKLIIFLVSIVFESNYFKIPSLEYKAGSDFSLNDLHYQLDSTNRNVKRFENICLINSGSLDPIQFRFELAQVIERIKKTEAKVIGIDLEFSNDSTIAGTSALLNQLGDTPRIVLAATTDANSDKLHIGNAVYGNVSFPDDQVTIRRYYSGDSTFAFKVSESFGSDVKKIANANKNFLINYSAHDYYLLNLNSSNPIADYTFTENTGNKLPVIDGAELLSDDSLVNSNVSQILKGKIVLIGHMGNTCLGNLKYDLEDKHPVPCDQMLINRQKSMPGVLIHANAVENMINPTSRFTVISDNFFFIAFEELLLTLYLCFLLFVKAGKVINILLMLTLSLPSLYMVLLLMNHNIYIEMGTTLLQLLVFEELTELIEPLYAKFERFKFRLTKPKFLRK